MKPRYEVLVTHGYRYAAGAKKATGPQGVAYVYDRLRDKIVWQRATEDRREYFGRYSLAECEAAAAERCAELNAQEASAELDAQAS